MSKRIKTKYTGIYYRESRALSRSGVERIYYAVFKKDGKAIEEKIGRQYQDNMTPAKAARIRGQLLDGRRATRQEGREQAKRKKWTLDNLWQEYTAQNAKRPSYATEKSTYNKHVSPSLGGKKTPEIVPLDVARIRSRMEKQGASPQTIKHALSLVKRLANFGEKRALCQNLNFKLTFPKVDNITTEDLTPNELGRLLDAIESDPHKAVGTMMKLALFTGMRRGEIAKLQWKEISFHRKFILIKEPKGGKSQEIPLNTEAEKLLSEWPKTEGSPYVFPGRNGGQRVSFHKQAKRIRDKAGLPPSFRPFHGLRHAYASMLASSGKVDLYTLQKLLTHKSPEMTQRYAHLRDDALRKAADIAGDIIATAMEEDKKENSSIVPFQKVGDIENG